jgi:hypothetical protein
VAFFFGEALGTPVAGRCIPTLGLGWQRGGWGGGLTTMGARGRPPGPTASGTLPLQEALAAASELGQLACWPASHARGAQASSLGGSSLPLTPDPGRGRVPTLPAGRGRGCPDACAQLAPQWQRGALLHCHARLAFQVDFGAAACGAEGPVSISSEKSQRASEPVYRDRDAPEPESQVRARANPSDLLPMKGASNAVCQESCQHAFCVPTTVLLTSSAAPSRWPRARLLSRLRKTRQTLNHVDCCTSPQNTI